MSRHQHPRAKQYSEPKLQAKFNTADPEPTEVILDGLNLMLPISTESSLSWKEPLKALLIALGQEPTKTVTFIIADSLQRHTLWIRNLGYILKLEASQFTNADIQKYVREKMRLRDLHMTLLAIDDPAERKTRFQAEVPGVLAKQMTQKGAGWKEKTQQVIKFLAETARETHGITPPITYPQVFYDADHRFRCLDWDALLERHDYDGLRAHVDDQYKSNDDFRAIIEKASTTFTAKQFQQEIGDREYPNEQDSNYSHFMDLIKQSSVEYLLEEAAITIGLMRSGEYSRLAYPFGEQDSNKPLFDLLQSLAQTVNSQMSAPAADDLPRDPSAEAAAHTSPAKIQPVAIHYTKRPTTPKVALRRMNIHSDLSAFSSPDHSNGSSPPRANTISTMDIASRLELEIEVVRCDNDLRTTALVADRLMQLDLPPADMARALVELANRKSPPPTSEASAAGTSYPRLTASSLAALPSNPRPESNVARSYQQAISPTSVDLHDLDASLDLLRPQHSPPGRTSSDYLPTPTEVEVEKESTQKKLIRRLHKSESQIDRDSGNGSTPSPNLRASSAPSAVFSKKEVSEIPSPPPIQEDPINSNAFHV